MDHMRKAAYSNPPPKSNTLVTFVAFYEGGGGPRVPLIAMVFLLAFSVLQIDLNFWIFGGCEPNAIFKET